MDFAGKNVLITGASRGIGYATAREFLALGARVAVNGRTEQSVATAITEFCHLLQGHWVLTSESGQVTDIKAGDSWVFPRGWKGTAEVVETVRKVYLIVS